MEKNKYFIERNITYQSDISIIFQVQICKKFKKNSYAEFNYNYK